MYIPLTSTKVLKAYMFQCEIYGWKPTDKGLNAFKKEIKEGKRCSVSFSLKWQ